ncbi:hypothetical protein B296_00037351, partial [Ensete ventricosum]
MQGLPYRAVRPRTGRYTPVRQLTSTRTARYQAVSSKSTVDGRFRPVLAEGGRKKKRDRKWEKNLVTPRAALPRFPCAICCPRAKNRLRDPLPAGHSFSLRGEMFCLPTQGEGTRR